MSTLILHPANEDFPATPRGKALSDYIAKCRPKRLLAVGTSCVAACVLGLTLVAGYQATRPAPDMVTFAFRV
ncbi:MAG: hypothetical protein AB7O57_11180 [Hyphomicrobiaceae bacterium]